MRSLHSDKIQTDSSDETLPFVPEEGDFGSFDRIYHEYAARLVVFARRFVTEKFAQTFQDNRHMPQDRHLRQSELSQIPESDRR